MHRPLARIDHSDLPMLEGTAQQHDPQNKKEATHSRKEEGGTYLQGADAHDVGSCVKTAFAYSSSDPPEYSHGLILVGSVSLPVTTGDNLCQDIRR
jgi:hypothetical protein